MKPGPSTAQPAHEPTPRSRRRPDLTLPIPDRSLAVPLPLPLPPTSSTKTSTTTSTTPSLSDLTRVRRLGSGAGGTVWLVLHKPSNTPFALKTLHPIHDPQTLTQIKREINILRLSHNPFIVPCLALFDNSPHQDDIHLLLEFMDQGSLHSKHIPQESKLADIAKQVLSGLAYLHRRKIVHRDIKPSNLLVNSLNRVKIADFGVSRILAQTMDPCNSSVGTIAYMSPERINTDLSGGVYDGYAGDIWSFGISMLEFYLGRFPFGENVDWASLMCSICYAEPPEAPEGCSREFRSFVAGCLRKNPGERLTALQLLQHPFITSNTSSLNSV